MPFIADGNADLKVRGQRLTPSVDLALMLDSFIFNEININKLTVKGQLDTAANINFYTINLLTSHKRRANT